MLGHSSPAHRADLCHHRFARSMLASVLLLATLSASGPTVGAMGAVTMARAREALGREAFVTGSPACPEGDSRAAAGERSGADAAAGGRLRAVSRSA